jgi:uncharacterized repeat protein (TIGR03917 family)
MTAVPPDPANGDEPSGAEAFVVLVRVERAPVAEHELSIVPGATAANVSSALVQIPANAELVDWHGEVDMTLVFREVPPAR